MMDNSILREKKKLSIIWILNDQRTCKCSIIGHKDKSL